MQKAIDMIHSEHRSISSVLNGLKTLVQAASDSKLLPEFEVFRAMVFYIDAFPERLHHPKEDEHLFARLQRRHPEARALVEELQAEHVKGAQLVRTLERALLEFEQTWPMGADKFAAAVEAYCQFHWNHMRKEETQLIPLAAQSLVAEDWAAIEAAFAGNNDAIADLREKDFEKLYQRILNLAPAPVGLGGQWKNK